jgi:hypothetical protein
MSNSLPQKTEAAVDYPAFHYAVLAEILTECAAPLTNGQVLAANAEARTVKGLPPADAVGIAEKLSIEAAEDSELSDLTPTEEVLLLHLME